MHCPLAAARYWLQRGIGEVGCDHELLRAWLERWWSRLPVAEQNMLEKWMRSMHRSLEIDAQRYVAAKQEHEERMAC